MSGAGQELAWLHEAIELGLVPTSPRRGEVRTDDAVWPGAAHEVVRAKLARMVEAGRGDQLGQGDQRLTMEMRHAQRLVGENDGALAKPVLRSDASWAAVGV